MRTPKPGDIYRWIGSSNKENYEIVSWGKNSTCIRSFSRNSIIEYNDKFLLEKDLWQYLPYYQIDLDIKKWLDN